MASRTVANPPLIPEAPIGGTGTTRLTGASATTRFGHLTLTNAAAIADLTLFGTHELPARLTVDIPFTGGTLTVTGAVIVGGGGTLTHSANATFETYRLALAVGGDLRVASGGALDVTGRGYASNQGPGGAKGSVLGGSHGGLGGSVTASLTYGSIVEPVNLGSGGRTAYGESVAGGGALWLDVDGCLTREQRAVANMPCATPICCAN